LVSQHKRSKTCTYKGPETKFPEIFDELFARANSHDKVSMTKGTMTKETGTPIKLAKTFVTKKKQKHKTTTTTTTKENNRQNVLIYTGK